MRCGKILVNELPVRTWNRLGVNGTELEWDASEVQSLPPENCTAEDGTAPVRMCMEGSGAYSRRQVRITAPAGRSITVFQTIRAQENLEVDTAVEAGADAAVRLVQLYTGGEGSRICSAVHGACGENGRVELVQILVGKGDVYADSRFTLQGDGAGLKADIGYLGQNRQTIDLNLAVDHFGKKTVSEIQASGALKDAAKKIFRGTIDFKRGSAGAVGNEQETVLMLGEDAQNKTVPLILCAEENVEGNHGATIGELDEETLFYFESRGIAREQAENLMARAAIERLARNLGDSEMQETVRGALEEEL